MARGAGDASTVGGKCWTEGDGCCNGADAVSRDALLPPVVKLGAGAPPAPTMDEAGMLATCSKRYRRRSQRCVGERLPSASCLDEWFVARWGRCGPGSCLLPSSRRRAGRDCGSTYRDDPPRAEATRSVALCCHGRYWLPLAVSSCFVRVGSHRRSAGTRLLTLLCPPAGRPMNSALMGRPLSRPRPVDALHVSKRRKPTSRRIILHRGRRSTTLPLPLLLPSLTVFSLHAVSVRSRLAPRPQPPESWQIDSSEYPRSPARSFSVASSSIFFFNPCTASCRRAPSQPEPLTTRGRRHALRGRRLSQQLSGRINLTGLHGSFVHHTLDVLPWTRCAASYHVDEILHQTVTRSSKLCR
jgi:hypothetical protein